MKTGRIYFDVTYDESKYELDDIGSAIDQLLSNALSTEGIMDAFGKPEFEPTLVAEYATEEEIVSARADYEDEEINIDEDACVSRGDDGTWVAAWVYLSADGE